MRPKPTKWKGESFLWAEHKADGHRVTLFRGPDYIHAIGRKTRIDLWPSLSRQMDISHIPPFTAIDGELVAVDRPASDVISALRYAEPVLFLPFAVPLIDRVPQFSTPIESVRTWLRQQGFETPEEPAAGFEEDMLNYIRNTGIEGLILKGGHLGPWWKVKPHRTVDAIVTNVIPGESEFTGMMGSLAVSVWRDGSLVEIANVGSGWTLAERAKIGEEVIGRVCEVKYDIVMAQGRLRFPTFLRWRDDKPSSECVLEG